MRESNIAGYFCMTWAMLCYLISKIDDDIFVMWGAIFFVVMGVISWTLNWYQNYLDKKLQEIEEEQAEITKNMRG